MRDDAVASTGEGGVVEVASHEPSTPADFVTGGIDWGVGVPCIHLQQLHSCISFGKLTDGVHGPIHEEAVGGHFVERPHAAGVPA